MLSFFQSSRNRAEPIYLYEVVYGSSVSERLFLTDAESPVSYLGNIYAVEALDHDEITASGSLDKSTVQLRGAFISPLTRIFLTYPPDRTVTLRILQGDRNDPDGEFIAIWAGRILDFSVEGFESKFECEPIGTAARRPGLRRNYQFTCPHVLYGPHCRANKLARTRTAPVTLLSGSTVTVAPGWNGSLDPASFQSGIAEWVGSSGGVVTRTILRVSLDGSGQGELLLGGLPTGLAPGAPVALSVGCNHQMSDCRDLHQNINNFGGQPWIPLKNPIGNYNNFY